MEVITLNEVIGYDCCVKFDELFVTSIQEGSVVLVNEFSALTDTDLDKLIELISKREDIYFILVDQSVNSVVYKYIETLPNFDVLLCKCSKEVSKLFLGDERASS